MKFYSSDWTILERYAIKENIVYKLVTTYIKKKFI